MHILVTGVAGFIGYHVARRLILEGHNVVGVDNYNDYYDVQLKKDRISNLLSMQQSKLFRFIELDIANRNLVSQLFEEEDFTHVINLAAQAGVRYSLINPSSYIDSNIVGFANILEGCRNKKIQHFVYASSSSVYGLNKDFPYSVNANVDHPISLYSASKKSNELMAHCYSHLFNIPSTGLRFFTVYGPWGRPDMALHLFATAIYNGAPIKVFNHGKMLRDFTYIDDVVEYVYRILELPPKISVDSELTPSTSSAPWRIFNVGNNNPIELNTFISILEDIIGKQAIKIMLPMQPGDVYSTWADIHSLIETTHYIPLTNLRNGIQKFIDWYKNYYNK
jgi:UDP-glucuronate 4-epimerase